MPRAPAADDPAKGAQAAKDAAKPTADAKTAGETLHYKGTVVDKDTGKPIAGATVVVRRSILRSSENRVLQETSHTTASRRHVRLRDPAGSVCLALPLHRAGRRAPRLRHRGTGSATALSMTRKNEKLNERPFFETVELRPAKPITGRVETPEGRPAAGVLVLAYSRTDKAGGPTEYCFTQAKTDAQGRFRLPITTPGEGAYWVKPKDYAPELFVVPKGKRGDMGTITLKKGVSVAGRVLDVQGKPIAGVFVAIEQQRGDRAGFEALDRIIDLRRDPSGPRRPTPTGDSPSLRCPRGNTRSSPARPTSMATGRPTGTRRPLPEVFAPDEADDQRGRDSCPAGDPRLALGRDRGALGR